MHVFTYGALMFSQVWTRVVQGAYTHGEAELTGFARKSVVGAEYPVIFPAGSACRLTGVVYFDVSSDDVERLDIFEGIYYFRQTVAIVLLDGTPIEAVVYVLEDRYRHIVSNRDWDPERFRRRGLASFLAHYKGFAKP
jgi:gamma-glutamylcyclotransferase (GGCT)/AIG2-like uncharacterized protein YtfP